jgi:hypothetical protein
VKTPERPLSARDLNARILTRELSSQFVAAVERGADGIAAVEHDPVLLINSLRWEIGAVTESRRAATQIVPMMSLLDTWALAVQMKTFVSAGGTGAALFGEHQGAVRAVVDDYSTGAEALARRLIEPSRFSQYQGFVESYTREHPLLDLRFARASVVELWSRESGTQVKLADSLGTIPEAMADFADRLEIYGDTVPSQVMWRTQLALREAGYTRDDVRLALSQLDQHLGRLTVVAESSPELVRSSLDEMRRTLFQAIDRVDASSARMLIALGVQRAQLAADVHSERAAVLSAVDVQRRAIALDAARIAEQAVKAYGEQVRRLAREIVLLLILFTIVVLGLPFLAGYWVGRARHARSARS